MASNATALHRIKAEIEALASELEQGETIDPFALRVIARQVEAQAEMQEEGL